jgi:hypothetical protein
VNALAKSPQQRVVLPVLNKREFERLADGLRADLTALDKAWGKDLMPDDVEKAERALKAWKAANGPAHWRRADELLNGLSGDACWDENGHIRLSVVSDAVRRLTGAFPTCNVPDAKTYTATLIEEIYGEDPDPIALDATVRRLQRTQTFLPALSEILKVLTEETATQSARLGAIEQGSFYANEAEQTLQKARAEAEARHQKKAVESARLTADIAQKRTHERERGEFAPGDLVRCGGERYVVTEVDNVDGWVWLVEEHGEGTCSSWVGRVLLSQAVRDRAAPPAQEDF